MKNRFKLAVALLLGAIAPLSLFTPPATATPRGMQGSYMGVTLDGSNLDQNLQSLLESGGAAIWLLDEPWRNGNSQGNGPTPPTQLQGRFDLTNSPVSLRGAVVVGDRVEAVLPVLSYDVHLGNVANLYAGAGYTLVRTPGAETALGDRNGVVLVTGAEAAVGDGLILYGDMRMRPELNREGDRIPVRLQLGVGRRF